MSHAWMLLFPTFTLSAVLAGLAHPARAEPILVFAAASTTDALQEIGVKFREKTGNQIEYSFAASNLLARQIIAGAPADVFFSADTLWMDRLVKAGLIVESDVRHLLSNRLVVIVNSAATTKIDSPQGLLSFKTIAVGDPKAVPVGLYARQWLESIGLWASIEPRILPTLNTRAALAAVAAGAADGGIVYSTDSALSKRVRAVYVAPIAPNAAIDYPVARIKASKKPAAKAFLNYLASSAAGAVFTRMGFIVKHGDDADR